MTDPTSPVLVSGRRLVQLWRIGSMALADWRTNGTFPATDMQGGYYFYDQGDIDAFHGDPSRALNFTGDFPLPTTAELLAQLRPHLPSLLLADEVMRLFSCTKYALWRRVHHGNLPVIALSRQVHRFPVSTTMAYLAAQDDTAVHIKIAAKALGVDVQKARRWMREGLLERSFVDTRPTYFYVTFASLRALIASWIHGPITADQWLHGQLFGDGRVVTKHRVMDMRHIAYKTLTKMVRNDELSCLVTVSGQTLIQLPYAMTLGRDADEHDPEEVRRLLQVTEADYGLLKRSHRFCRKRRSFCERQACTRAYIEANLVGMTLEEWQAMVDDDIPSMTGEEFINSVPGMTEAGVEFAVNENGLRGLRLPILRMNLGWRFARHDAVAYRRRHERLMRGY